MPGESYDDDEDEQEGPKSSFATYLAEGDVLFKQSEFKKALESYSLALELQSEDKNCLVARSKCYLKLGDPQKALQDAEEALAEDKEFNKGLYRKAEALYSMGDFEYALMYYHRGHNLRPELDEFRLGIQKAQEAIDNSIGNAAKIKLESKGDLSFFNRQDDLGSKKRGGYIKPRNLKLKPTIANRNKEVKPPAPSKKTVKQLLGELYADKEYLEKLMKDDDYIKSHSSKPVYELVQGGLTYLDTRTEFWRQQKPLYARKKDIGKSAGGRKKKVKISQGKQVLKQLEEVDQALANGDAEHSLKLAQLLLKSVEEANVTDLPDKAEVLANVHSCIGNAFVELENFDKALKHHQKDLDMSLKSKSKEGKSRALDNVGRVYARMGDYAKAVESWNEKLPLVKTPLETTWIYHEIGRCHLELGDYAQARDCGKKSLSAAHEFDDEVWQLNASVLVAQASVKLGKLKESLEKFQEAKALSTSLSDTAAETAISKAISDLEKKIDEEGAGTTTDPTDENTYTSASEDEDDTTPRVSDKESDHDVTSDVDYKDDDGTTSDQETADEKTDERTDDIHSPRDKSDVDKSEKSDKEEDTGSQTEEDPTDSLMTPRKNIEGDATDNEVDDKAGGTDVEDEDTTDKKPTTEDSTDETTADDTDDVDEVDEEKRPKKSTDSYDENSQSASKQEDTATDDATTTNDIKTDDTDNENKPDAVDSTTDNETTTEDETATEDETTPRNTTEDEDEAKTTKQPTEPEKDLPGNTTDSSSDETATAAEAATVDNDEKEARSAVISSDTKPNQADDPTEKEDSGNNGSITAVAEDINVERTETTEPFRNDDVEGASSGGSDDSPNDDAPLKPTEIVKEETKKEDSLSNETTENTREQIAVVDGQEASDVTNDVSLKEEQDGIDDVHVSANNNDLHDTKEEEGNDNKQNVVGAEVGEENKEKDKDANDHASDKSEGNVDQVTKNSDKDDKSKDDVDQVTKNSDNTENKQASDVAATEQKENPTSTDHKSDDSVEKKNRNEQQVVEDSNATQMDADGKQSPETKLSKAESSS